MLIPRRRPGESAEPWLAPDPPEPVERPKMEECEDFGEGCEDCRNFPTDDGDAAYDSEADSRGEKPCQ